MIEHESRDLTAKEESPKLPDVDELIEDLAASMVSDGYLMSSSATYWVSILSVKMQNEELRKGVTGVVFCGVYSTHERAMAGSRGIVEDIAMANKDEYPKIEFESSIIETHIDVVPNSDMHRLTETTMIDLEDPE